MVADYVATVFPADGRAFPIYAIAMQPTGSLFHQAIYTSGYGFTLSELNRAGDEFSKRQADPGNQVGPSQPYLLRPGQRTSYPSVECNSAAREGLTFLPVSQAAGAFALAAFFAPRDVRRLRQFSASVQLLAKFLLTESSCTSPCTMIHSNV